MSNVVNNPMEHTAAAAPPQQDNGNSNANGQPGPAVTRPASESNGGRVSVRNDQHKVQFKLTSGAIDFLCETPSKWVVVIVIVAIAVLILAIIVAVVLPILHKTALPSGSA
jgi:hypothetical protein